MVSKVAVGSVVVPDNLANLAKLKGARILFQWQERNMWSLGTIQRRLAKKTPADLEGHIGYSISFDAEDGVREVWLSLNNTCALRHKNNKAGSWCIIGKPPTAAASAGTAQVRMMALTLAAGGACFPLPFSTA